MKNQIFAKATIEHVLVREGEDADKVFWEREKYWQAQLFTLTHRINNMNEMNGMHLIVFYMKKIVIVN